MQIVEREITDAELRRMKSGFDEHAAEHGNPPETSDRVSFVASKAGVFVGCASGLAYRKTVGYADWFYLTDLFVEKPFRGQGVGRALLDRLEQKVVSLGIGHAWTWTAAYEAPAFYRRQGYAVFLEQADYFSSGHARLGFHKSLRSG